MKDIFIVLVVMIAYRLEKLIDAITRLIEVIKK